jgi:hypothetical protein
MIFAPFRYVLTGIFIGIVMVSLSNDYVIISRRKYERLKEKHKHEDKDI